MRGCGTLEGRWGRATDATRSGPWRATAGARSVMAAFMLCLGVQDAGRALEAACGPLGGLLPGSPGSISGLPVAETFSGLRALMSLIERIHIVEMPLHALSRVSHCNLHVR